MQKTSFKNVLIALPNDSLGGAEQYLKMVARYHIERNDKVHVFFLKRQKDNGWSDIHHNNLKLHYTSSPSESRGVVPLANNILKCRAMHFDRAYTSHVHLNSFIGLLLLNNLLKVKQVIGRESTSIFKRYTKLKLLRFKFLYKIGYSKINLLICQTHYMKDQLVNALPELSKKINIQVIPNPINLSNIKLQQDGVGGFDVPSGDYIVSAGRLIPEKGFDILISVFAEVKKVYPELKLLLLGEGKDRTSLTTQIESLGLNDSVALPGFVTNVYPYFNRAKLCVVSSRIEGFPNVLLQMMSQNDKVVSTTCAGDIDAIPGLFLSETHNEESLYKAIIKSLEADTGANRKIFDEFLDERSIESFMDKIDNQLANA